MNKKFNEQHLLISLSLSSLSLSLVSLSPQFLYLFVCLSGLRALLN